MPPPSTNPILSVFSDAGRQLLQSNPFPVASKYLPVYFLVVIMKIDRTCLYQLFELKEIEFCVHIFSCHYTPISSCKLVWKVKIPGGERLFIPFRQ